MPTKFSLGQRVKITGTAIKVREDERTIFQESALPEWHDSWAKTATIDEGVIVGSRTVAEGARWWDGDESGSWSGFTQKPGTARRVWLVAFHLRRKPVMCFDHQVEALPIPETIEVPTPRIPFPGGRSQEYFMRTAAKKISNDQRPGGYHVTAAVVKLLEDTASAMDAA